MQRNAMHRRVPRRLASLKRALREAKITNRQVAAEAGVVDTVVCHVLAGRAVSANVVSTAKRLLASATAPAAKAS